MFEHKSGFVSVTTLLTVVAVLFMACGCQDSKARKAGKDVRQAVENAQRIYDTAQAMLANPVYINTAKNEVLPGDPAANNLNAPDFGPDNQKIWDAIIKIQTMAPDSDDPNLKPSPGVLRLKDVLLDKYGVWKSSTERWATPTLEDILQKGEAALTVIDKLNEVGFIKDVNYIKLREELARLAVPSVLPTPLPSSRPAPKVFTPQNDEEQLKVIEPYLRSAANPASIEVTDRKLLAASMPAGGAASTHSLSLSPMDPTLVINPKVPAKLKEAEAVLTKAIDDNKEAPKSDLMLAYSMRGRVRCLMGYYYFLTSKPYSQAIDCAAMRGEWVAWLMKLDSDKKPYLDKLLEIQNDSTDLKTNLLDFEDKAKQIQSDINANADEQKKNVDETEKLKSRISALNSEIMDLRAKSALQKGEESIKTYDLTVPKNKEIKDSYSKIGQLEIKLDELKVQGKQLQANLATANAKVTAGKDISDKRAKTKGQIDAQQKGIDERLKVWQELMTQISSEMVDLAGIARASFEDAKKAYDLAKKDFSQVDADCMENDKSSIQAQLGDLRMTLGEQMVRNYQILDRIKVFAAYAKSVCEAAKAPIPASLASLDECAKTMDDIKKDAVTNFSDAAKNFETAANRLDRSLESLNKDSAKSMDARDLRWAYQGRMADAYVMLLTLDPTNAAYLTSADEALKKALSGAEASPMLENLRRLQELILPKK